MTDYASAPPTSLSTDAEVLLKEIAAAPLAVLCGRNNSGKSFLLRQLLERIGDSAYYLGPGRYFNFNTLTPYNPSNDRRRRRFRSLINHFRNASQNVDNSPLDLGQAISELSDTKRDSLFEMLRQLLGSTTSVELTVPGNSMSQRYVRVDDFNLAFQSSGFRLAATLLTCLLDEDSAVFIIDEPELGLSPEAQGIISDFLFDPVARAKYFPHLKGLVLATHSPIFLNRAAIESNYFVSRSGTVIHLRRLSSLQDITSLQFQLLGNRLDTLFLPSAIILVEGIADHLFISRVVALRYPGSLISVVQCGGDGRMPDVLSTARTFLGDLQRSPYHTRVFCVLDATHERSVPERLIKSGVHRDNIIVWSQNGIEYFYPEAALRELFGASGPISISGDDVTINGIVSKKRELADQVAARLTPATMHNSELVGRLLKPLDALLTN